MIKFNFNNQTRKGHTFTLKLECVWPQCCNSVCDFLLINPNNFATNINSITTRVECDNKIISKNSQVRLAELDEIVAKTSIIKKNHIKITLLNILLYQKIKELYYLV